MSDLQDNPTPPQPEAPKDELLKLFDEEERSFFKRLVDMGTGLTKPRDSLEFKKAIIELQRLWAPICAILVPVVAILIMGMIKIGGKEAQVQIETQVIEAEESQQLEKEEPPPPEEPPELDETPVEVDTPVVDIDAPPTTSAEQSPQPAEMDAVALTPSPVIMKGVMGSRDPGLRGAKIGSYGGGDVEKYLYGVLRYLVTKQNKDGTWGGANEGQYASPVGETSLALLTFLAHGETPSSPEFGKTVEKGIRALLDLQIKTDADGDHKDGPDGYVNGKFRRGRAGYFRKRDQNNYSQLLAVYALSEAYAMTRIPEIKDALTLALPHIYNGQNADGGFYYNLDSKCPISDSSYSGWAVQALKAAKIAGFHEPKLIEALKRSARGVKVLQEPSGAFVYTTTSKQNRGLTAVGALLLQMLDEGDTDAGKKAIAYMDSWEPTFKKNFKGPGSNAKQMQGGSPQYYCYYLAQVRFNLGASNNAWKRWNAQMSKLYRAAFITIPAEKSGYVDDKGQAQYIGYFGTKRGKSKFKGDANPVSDKDRLMQDRATKNGSRNGIPVDELLNDDHDIAGGHVDPTNDRVLSNCVTALQLMVYFRNSPLAKGALTKIETEASAEVSEGAAEVTIEGADDL